VVGDEKWRGAQIKREENILLCRNSIKFKQRKFCCTLNAPVLSHYYFSAEEEKKEAKENQENLQEKEFDFKFTIAANLITGTEIKLRNG
jgi:hypothetical protein